MRLACPLTLEAAATWIPQGRETAAQAAACGRITAGGEQEIGVTAVPVSDLSAPDMAVRAAGRALQNAGRDPATVGLIAHAWTYHQGHDFWSPTHYIANEIGAHRALPIGVQQLSNGGTAALGIAGARFATDTDLDAAVVTTADRFTPPGFDRWSADYGVVYGDTGTALLLRRHDPGQSGELTLRSLAFVTDARFEIMYRGREDFSPTPLARDGRVDVRRTKKAYLEMHGGTGEFHRAATASVHEVLTRALAEAELAASDPHIRYVALPRLSDAVLQDMYLPVLDGLVNAEMLILRENSGHLGAGDMLANIAHINDNGLLSAGDYVVALGGGGGFTWSCAVLQAT